MWNIWNTLEILNFFQYLYNNNKFSIKSTWDNNKNKDFRCKKKWIHMTITCDLCFNCWFLKTTNWYLRILCSSVNWIWNNNFFLLKKIFYSWVYNTNIARRTYNVLDSSCQAQLFKRKFPSRKVSVFLKIYNSLRRALRITRMRKWRCNKEIKFYRNTSA